MTSSKMLILEVVVERAVGFRFQHNKDIVGCFCVHKKHPDGVGIILEVIAPDSGDAHARSGKVAVLCGPTLSVKKQCCISELTPYKPLGMRRAPKGCVQVALPVTDSSGSDYSSSSSSSDGDAVVDGDGSDSDYLTLHQQDGASSLVAIEPLSSLDNYTSQ